MQPTSVEAGPETDLPDHKQLPDKDGSIVNNFAENPQSALLTSTIKPRLDELHPDGQYAVGMDSGIYYRHTTPPLAGCKAPGWFYVPNVPPMLDGEHRRSYVLWKEVEKPLLVVEYVSGDGREEHDTTPYKGKFWAYERGICAGYYAIYDAFKATIELYKLDGGRYVQVAANAAGRYLVEPLGLELGPWQATILGMDLPWLRVWDAATGQMIPSYEERAETAESLLDDYREFVTEAQQESETERKRADEAEAKAKDAEAQRDDERHRVLKLAEKLRSLGIDPDAA